jgi:predicted TIM-barrel fold metal-dependent hydrolase
VPAGELPDVFDGTDGAVPDGLAQALTDVRLIDHHVHGVFAAPVDRPTFEASLNEGSTDPVPAFMTQMDSPLGFAIRRWCAPFLGLERHAPADHYWAVREGTDHDALASTMLRAAGVDRWVVDTGFNGDLITSPERLTELSGRPSSVILRLEPLIEELALSGLSPADFPEVFRQRLTEVAAGVVGVKTIAAYRCGFDIDWARPQDDAVVTAFARQRHPERVDDPVLIAFAVHEAAALGLPIQVHVGFGDRDLDLHRVDPLLLLPLLRSMDPVPVLLLHCYPFHRQAGYLAQAFDHVYFDVGLAINHLGPRSAALVAEAMETAPYAKQLYSSDAFGPPELHLLGSVLWRRAMGLTLGAWVRSGDWSESDAVRVVQLIGVDNARRVYRLEG